jgi:hypothetical protein
MVPVARKMRAYFAPIDRVAGTPTLFDPAKHGVFSLDDPPKPWIDLGWLESFEQQSETQIESVGAAPAEPTSNQFRTGRGGRVEFDFREWGKLQMALAGGSEHMNVLAADPDAGAQPVGGSALPAVVVREGSTATELVLGPSADVFAKGDLVAVDLEYQQSSGYVGSVIAGAYVRDPVDVGRDINFIRRVTFNVGRISQITANSLLLAQSLPGGAPLPGAGVQRVVAFVDREGGAFFQEWSALFVWEAESGGRVCFYYPRLAPAGNTKNGLARETKAEIGSEASSLALHASFRAIPIRDEIDGAMVHYYRSYFPTAMAAVY